MEDSIYAIVLALAAYMIGPSGAKDLPATGVSNVPVQRARPLPSDRQPSGNPESVPSDSLVSLFSTDDYPKEASERGEQGIVDVTLTVGPDGKVTDCVVNLSSGSPSLDVQTCRILWGRAHFTPARDVQGKPVQDTFRQRVRWELPVSDPEEVAEQFARYIITVDAANSVVDCHYEASLDWQTSDPNCPLFLEDARQLVSSAPDWVQFSGKDLVSEVQLRVGDPQGGIELGERSDEHALSISRTDLTVDALGKVKTCSRDSWGPVRMNSDQWSCDVVRRWMFEELPAEETNRNDRHLTVVNALYLRNSSGH